MSRYCCGALRYVDSAHTIVSAAGGTVQIADINNGGGKISDGSYTYRAQQIDPAGNISVVSIGLTVRIDATTPAAPTQVSLDPSTDSGTFNNDGITFFNNSSPTRIPLFNVTGVEAGATVVLFRNGVQVNVLTNSAGGTVTNESRVCQPLDEDVTAQSSALARVDIADSDRAQHVSAQSRDC